MAKNMKRIHKITIKRMLDESPDTSWLGEYSDRAKSNYTIDRKHTHDCASQTYNVTVEGIRTLKHAITYLNDTYLHGKWPSDSIYVDDCTDAGDILGETLDAIGECDCGESGDMERNQYRYFNPSRNYDNETPENVIKYTLQDYERMESLNRGNWCFIGIRVDAEYSVGESKGGYLRQELTSGGLWGIESDSDKSYFAEVEREELAELQTQLENIGFSKRAIAAAFKNTEREEN